MKKRRKVPGTVRAILRFAFLLVRFSMFLIVVAWLVGRVFSDRYAWSQWLWWIPTPALLPVVALGLLASLRRARKPKARRNRILRWAVCGFGLLIYFAAIEHRFLHATLPIPPSGTAIKVVQWNFAHSRNESDDRVIDQLLLMNGDITVLTGPAHVAWDPRLAAQLDAGNGAQSLGTLTVLTKFPIVTFRPMVVAENVFLLGLEIDTSAVLGRPIILYVIDLPSNPRKHRMELARKVRALMDETGAPTPDLVVGDFNIIRGSASIEAIFSGMSNAYDEAGHGNGASFPRNLPLYHIDHVLLSSSLKAMRYDLLDPGVSRHRAQVAWIGRRGE